MNSTHRDMNVMFPNISRNFIVTQVSDRKLNFNKLIAQVIRGCWIKSWALYCKRLAVPS